MANYIEHYLFQTGNVYSLTELNDMLASYAANDQRLLDLVAMLQEYMSTTPYPVPGLVKSPAQLQAWVDMVYDAGNTAERIYSVVSPEQPRYLGELYHLFDIEPFKSLKAGVDVRIQDWLPILRVFSMLKGMIYLVEDGPNYEVDPVFVKDGSFYFTSITEVGDSTQHLICDETGKVASIGGNPVYRSLPLGASPITLIEFFLRRLEVRRLRMLYRLSAFEAGIDAKYRNDASYNLVDRAFTHSSSPEIESRRLPCGFTQPGKLLFLRTEAGSYRGASLAPFIPGATPTSGVEDRVVMSESLLMTPMGVIRIPKSIIRWGHLITESDRLSVDGDPVVFVGLKVTLELTQRDPILAEGVATPADTSGSGFNGGITLLEKDEAPVIQNWPTPLSGTQKVHLDRTGKWGHQHGTLIGFIQQDAISSPGGKIAQYGQVQVEVVAVPTHGKILLDSALAMPQATPDELTAINANAQTVDPPPYRVIGLAPRRVLDILQTASPQPFPGLNLDVDQGVLVSVTKTPGVSTKWEVVVPLFLHLMKNQQPFTLDNLNGCQTRFVDGWAIRTISSVQPGLNTLAFDDGTGSPENFPEDFIGAAMTVFKADGTSVQTTLVGRIGDKLAKLPKGVVDTLVAGDVATFDRRQPSASLDGAYLREASSANIVDLRPKSYRMVDPTVTTSSIGLLSPSPSPAVPWTSLHRQISLEQISKVVGAYVTTPDIIESKIRWNYPQAALFKASERRDLIQLAGLSQADLKQFLVRWANNYDANSPHEWVAGEGVIIHWPEKNPETKVKLARYLPPAVPGQEDGITVETLEGWGVVPIFTRHIRSGEHYRYPLRFEQGLTFASEKSFSIPGHTKLAGSFNLDPRPTWIVDSTVNIRLYQTRNIRGSYQKVFLGSVEFDWERPTSFQNAVGVFRIDGDARYEPTSQFVLLNYNQILDFTNDEPGELSLTFTYHDLSEVHPIFNFQYDQIGLRLAHLSKAEPLALVDGEFKAIDGLTMRLEGMSLNEGRVYLRFNREDSFAILAKHGFIKTRWVLSDIPILTITKVTTDPSTGKITDVEYDATMVRRDMTISTLLADEKRNKQVYLPCNLKYGWADLAQSNIHTEALPFNASARFGFFEPTSALDAAGALVVPSANTVFRPSDQDYRFLAPFSGSTTGMTPIKSFAVLKHLETGEIRTFIGLYRKVLVGAIPSALEDELTLETVQDQTAFYIRDSELDTKWVVEFAGVLVAIRDEVMATTPGGDSKLSAVGYWYAGHDVIQRALTVKRTAQDVAVLDLGIVAKDAAFWRIGDVPGYLYRDNTILEADRTRP